VKEGDLAEQRGKGQVYYTYKQYVQRRMYLVVKTSRDDPRVITAIRDELRRADPELALFDVKNMPERLSGSMRNRRAAMAMCLVFAALALLLSAIGIYGVLAYTVTQRTREFGIRLALGAGGRDVLGMVVGHGVRLAAIGLAIGIAGAFGLTRLMTTMLFEVKPSDPAVYLTVGAALMTVALVASLIPSLRAIRIHPSTALRWE
jgi:ABC-type antimicrobial peptide transport system permease subunit